MHKIELICYAGSLACLKAALNSGADRWKERGV